MNTKWSATLAFAALAPTVFAQQGPPPGGPPRQGGNGMNRSVPQTRVATTPTSETVRLVSLSAVQNDLGLTLNQWTGINAAVRSLRGASTTEDQALATVSKALTAAQSARLKELLVQDLGYGSLALTDVRAQLTLTAEQAKSMTFVLSTFDTAKKALASASPEAAQKALADLQSQTNASLAKLLTSEQDAKLRSLAGRALGGK